jgi:hypothetical protein
MTYTDSEAVTATVDLLGLWIHDPLDAQGTAGNYPYARAQRSSSINTMGSERTFAGRVYPVVDYGEHQEDTFSVRVDVPHGDDWTADLGELTTFAQSRRTLCFRDGRGRLFFGAMGGYDEADQEWGTAVGFTVRRVDYQVGT